MDKAERDQKRAKDFYRSIGDPNARRKVSHEDYLRAQVGKVKVKKKRKPANGGSSTKAINNPVIKAKKRMGRPPEHKTPYNDANHDIRVLVKDDSPLAKSQNSEELGMIAYLMTGNMDAAAKLLGLKRRELSRIVSKPMRNITDYLDHPVRYSMEEEPVTRRQLLTSSMGYVIGLYLRQLAAPALVKKTNARSSVDVVVKLIEKLLTLLGRPSAIIGTVGAVLPPEEVSSFLTKLGYRGNNGTGAEYRRIHGESPAISLGGEAVSGVDSPFNGIDKAESGVPREGDTELEAARVPAGMAEVPAGEPVHDAVSAPRAREEHDVRGSVFPVEDMPESERANSIYKQFWSSSCPATGADEDTVGIPRSISDNVPSGGDTVEQRSADGAVADGHTSRGADGGSNGAGRSDNGQARGCNDTGRPCDAGDGIKPDNDAETEGRLLYGDTAV